MIHFLLASENTPFTIALVLMVAIGALELVFSIFGPGLSHLIETGLPDLNHELGDMAPHDAHALDDVPSPLSKLLGWLRIGQVPLLILFVVFLTAFGVIGLALQFTLASLTKFMLPAPVAGIAAFLAAIPCVRTGGGLLAKILPRDETTAVSEDSFVGRIAVITSGAARQGSPAEARLQDQHRQSHYILVEPDVEGEEFPSGSTVLIVEKHANIYRAIQNPNSALVD